MMNARQALWLPLPEVEGATPSGFTLRVERTGTTMDETVERSTSSVLLRDERE